MEKKKHKPLRMCVSCRLMKEKGELIKLTKTCGGEIVIGVQQDGRGAYVCKSLECIEKAEKKRQLQRALKSEISGEIYQSLKGLCE